MLKAHVVDCSVGHNCLLKNFQRKNTTDSTDSEIRNVTHIAPQSEQGGLCNAINASVAAGLSEGLVRRSCRQRRALDAADLGLPAALPHRFAATVRYKNPV